MRKLIGRFRRTSFRPVKRVYFDDTKGYRIYLLRNNSSNGNANTNDASNNNNTMNNMP